MQQDHSLDRKLLLPSGSVFWHPFRAEKVRKTKKLLKLKVDTGSEERTVVSGIAEFYSPEEIIGKQVCLLANLAPRAIKGIESQGMILMAESPDGTLAFVLPNEAVTNGSTVS